MITDRKIPTIAHSDDPHLTQSPGRAPGDQRQRAPMDPLHPVPMCCATLGSLVSLSGLPLTQL